MKPTYIAGPMSGHQDFNYPAFNAAAAKLRAAGYGVVNPAETPLPQHAEWSEHMRHDIRQLTCCDAVALLDGWENSRGANLEVTIARALGMRVGLIEEYLREETAV